MFQRGRYQVYSPAVMAKDDLENTGQVELPMEIISQIDIDKFTKDSPMHFSFRNPSTNAIIYSGVREFKGSNITMPHWMMEFIGADEGSIIEVSLANLRKATRVLFQPNDDDFNKLNVQAVLEVHLRSHFCLTQGTKIPIKFGHRTYFLKVLKTEPAPAVLLYHSDVNTEFAPPPSKFDHNWNDPDTDSSDNEIKAHIGHTIKGAVIQEKKKPIHSTLASRKEALKTNPAIMGIRKFQQGQEVTVPHPKVKENHEEKENLFVGESHFIKPKKGKKSKSNPPQTKQNLQQPDDEIVVPDNPDLPPPKDTNPFKGVPRSLKQSKGQNNQNINAYNQNSQNNQNINANKPKYISNNNQVSANNPINSQSTANKAPVPPSNLSKKEEYNPFAGKPRTLRKY